MTSSNGLHHGAATLTWISQASFKPPLVMAAIRPTSNVFRCLAESRVAAIHILDANQQEMAQRFFSPTCVVDHTINGEPYYLGVFLVGAYQEILGDLHNLFGDTNAVHIKITDSGYEITDLVHGDTVTEVLNYVQFHASDLLATFRDLADRSEELGALMTR